MERLRSSSVGHVGEDLQYATLLMLGYMPEKMKTLEVSESELLAMKQFYQQEYQNAVRKLEHLSDILNKMGADVPQVSGLEPSTGKSTLGTTVKSSVAPKRTRKKKRGPKPVWGNFILNRIKAADRPVGYPELIRDAMVLENIPEEKRSNAKASILNSAFRLRKVNNKIETIGIPGKKEKFLVLTKWMENGELVSPYKEKFESIVNLRKAEEEEKERQKPAPRPVGRPRKFPKDTAQKSTPKKTAKKTGLKRSTASAKKAGTTRTKAAASKTTTRKTTKSKAKKTTAKK